jgi:hypothetical protein
MFAEMDTEGVASVMRALTDNGRSLDTAWQSGKAAVSAHEPGIGTDLLGQAFRADYTPDSQAVRDSADWVPKAIRADAEVGTASAADYLAADNSGAAAMPR